MLDQGSAEIGVEPPQFTAAGCAHQFIETQPVQLGETPGTDYFAANAMLESGFTFEHQHPRTLLRHRSCECRTGQAATHHDDVIFALRHGFPPTIKTLGYTAHQDIARSRMIPALAITFRERKMI